MWGSLSCGSSCLPADAVTLALAFHERLEGGVPVTLLEGVARRSFVAVGKLGPFIRWLARFDARGRYLDLPLPYRVEDQSKCTARRDKRGPLRITMPVRPGQASNAPVSHPREQVDGGDDRQGHGVSPGIDSAAQGR